MTYREFCQLKANDPEENIFPKGTEPEEAIEILKSSLINNSNCVSYYDIIEAILNKYKKKHNKYEFDNIINAQQAINILRTELLPKDWYISYPCSYFQANTEIVASILYKYNNPESKYWFRIKKLICNILHINF